LDGRGGEEGHLEADGSLKHWIVCSSNELAEIARNRSAELQRYFWNILELVRCPSEVDALDLRAIEAVKGRRASSRLDAPASWTPSPGSWTPSPPNSFNSRVISLVSRAEAEGSLTPSGSGPHPEDGGANPRTGSPTRSWLEVLSRRLVTRLSGILPQMRWAICWAPFVAGQRLTSLNSGPIATTNWLDSVNDVVGRVQERGIPK
jgi:hypothetical protein